MFEPITKLLQSSGDMKATQRICDCIVVVSLVCLFVCLVFFFNGNLIIYWIIVVGRVHSLVPFLKFTLTLFISVVQLFKRAYLSISAHNLKQ